MKFLLFNCKLYRKCDHGSIKTMNIKCHFQAVKVLYEKLSLPSTNYCPMLSKTFAKNSMKQFN